MSRYTLAYSAFLSRLNEVEVLIRFAKEREQLDPIKFGYETNALCRGAIVLLSSHLEAFIKELGEVALDSLFVKKVKRKNISSRMFFYISKNFFDELKETSDPERIAEKFFVFLSKDSNHWSKEGVFPSPIPIDEFNRSFSNPTYSKIRQYFNRFGYEDYQRDLASSLNVNYMATINMVDHLVDTRNKIAHGDPTATKTPSDVSQMTASIRRYVSTTDNVFATWWKNNFCSIR